MPSLLVVEDDEAIAIPLARALAREGFAVSHVGTGAEALAALEAGGIDAVVLDLGLPDMDGGLVCEKAKRRHPLIPVLMLTARSSELDEVMGLDAGADDYLTKPFSLAVLIARIRALLRRTETPEALEYGGVRLEHEARRVTRDDSEIELTPTEFDLLELLMRNAGLVVRREAIMEGVWGPGWFGSTKTLDVHAAALRRKLGEPEPFTTVRGIGYRFERS